jgi:RNA-binding protein YlmH
MVSFGLAESLSGKLRKIFKTGVKIQLIEFSNVFRKRKLIDFPHADI